MAKVREFELFGYFKNELAIYTKLNINSARLAELRFKKRNSMLLGNWRVDIKLAGDIVHTFAFSNQLELNLVDVKCKKVSKKLPKTGNNETNKVSKKLPMKPKTATKPKKVSKKLPAKQETPKTGVNPCIRAGKEAMKVLERVYSDGMIPMAQWGRQVIPYKYLYKHDSWHGRGRSPKWLNDYKKSGKPISDINVDLSNCDY